MSHRPYLFLAVGLCLAAGFSTSAGDWPTWRGPLRNGISMERDLLPQWPSEGPALAWKAEGLGKGYTSVSVSEGRVFLAGDQADSAYIIAVNLADGKQIWSVKLGGTGEPGGYKGPRGTPTVDKDLVFTLGQDGDLVANESATGKEVWRHHLRKEFGGQVGGWGYSESPLVDGDKVLCSPGGRKGTVMAFNRRTGQSVWRSEGFNDAADYSSLVPVPLGGVHQYVQLTQQHVVGLGTEGQVLWKANRVGATAVIPTPVIVGNLVYVTSGYGVGCNVFQVSGKGNDFSASELYANKSMVNHHGGVIHLAGRIYGHSDNGGWTCQDLKTGNVLWRSDKLGKGSIAYADGRFYLRSESGRGTIVLIEANPAAWVEKGRFNQPDRSNKNSWPHPVIAQGKLFIRDQDVLLCYDVKAK